MTSWRSVLPIHPAAELFPLVGHDELPKIGRDIAEHGLQVPLAICRDDHDYDQYLLLDGRNRLDALEAVGIDVSVKGPPQDWRAISNGGYNLLVETKLVTGNPYEYVISANILRRHLTAKQRRDLTAKLIKATPEKSDRQIAEMVKASPTTVGAVRKQLENTGDVSKLDTRTDSKGRQQPATRAPRVERHVCWQCGVRDEVGKVRKRHYAEHEDVWLHSACVAAFEKSLAATRATTKVITAEQRKAEYAADEPTPAPAHSEPASEPKKIATCSFCAKNSEQVLVMIQGPRPDLYICDECIDRCVDVIRRKIAESPAAASDPGRASTSKKNIEARHA